MSLPSQPQAASSLPDHAAVAYVSPLSYAERWLLVLTPGAQTSDTGPAIFSLCKDSASRYELCNCSATCARSRTYKRGHYVEKSMLCIIHSAVTCYVTFYFGAQNYFYERDDTKCWFLFNRIQLCVKLRVDFTDGSFWMYQFSFTTNIYFHCTPLVTSLSP
jgi:hypothetical protein